MMNVILWFCVPLAAARTVLVTGATGQTGSLAYLQLKQEPNVTVRALVRDAAKAKKILGCNKCDESEGIFVGDVTKPETLATPMANVDVLLIAVGAIKNTYEIFVTGTMNQVAAFATAPGASLMEKQIVKVSTMDTTKLWDAIVAPFFYHGVSDQYISVAGIPYTIVQPCGLGADTLPAHKSKLLVSRDDLPFQGGTSTSIARADVAQVISYAATHPTEAVWLKFDLCADSKQQAEGTQEQDMQGVFKQALLPWDARAKTSAKQIVV